MVVLRLARRNMPPGPEKNSQNAAHERRAMPRFDMRLPAAVHLPDALTGELLTETQNVSARGLFFYLDRALTEGSRVELIVTFPPHITLTDPVRVKFTVRVVRAETHLPASRIGIAALIEEYEFLQSSPIPDFLSGVQ